MRPAGPAGGWGNRWRRTPGPAVEGARLMIRLALTYARRELRTGLRGFGVFLACLAIGVAAIGGVNAVAAGVLGGLQQEGRAILGGDLSLRRLVQPFEADQIAFLQERAATVTETAEM